LPASWGACESALPTSFTATCGGCHPGAGPANPRYPDLFQFAGSEQAFIQQARSGSQNMSAYGDAQISTEDLQASYAFFTANANRALGSTLQGVEPLFGASDAKHPAIVFQRDDGVLVTRAAGRVRQRHEHEATFNPFGPHYFEDRSYGFIIEDYTPTGESLIRVSYLPVAMPTEGTNFRAWKIYGDGNVFYANMGMDPGELPPLVAETPGTTVTALDPALGALYSELIAPFATVQVQETTANPRTDDVLTTGDVFEFEFGVFIEPDAVREGSRATYYSDTFRYQVGIGGLTARSDDTAGILGPKLPAQQGAAGTNVWLYEDQEFAFEQMALNIQHENVQAFLRGRRLFHTDFETGEHTEGGNPAFDEQAGKAGPLLAAKSCESCHVHNGPGALVDTFDEATSMTFKLFDASGLGRQLQLQEGDARVVEFETSSVTLADGTSVSLKRPLLALSTPEGPIAHYSARVARKVIGLGLLEAIPEATVLERADPADCDRDGISGRALLTPDPESGKRRLGRFGWKSEKVSVRHQVLDALEGDLGVGSNALPDSAGNAELAEAELEDLTAYMRLLSVPAQRDIETEAVLRGEGLFRTVGCANCHQSDTVTGLFHPFAELRGQAIKPYTDLLLHDMGEGLADASGIALSDDPLAPPAAQEWRTPPLWGLGLHAVVNGNTGLLHDGRAATPIEAILWHGGEAQGARDRFVALLADERSALLAFLESL
jgi:CxxC motif-containing protein (DUF1111 family)